MGGADIRIKSSLAQRWCSRLPEKLSHQVLTRHCTLEPGEACKQEGQEHTLSGVRKIKLLKVFFCCLPSPLEIPKFDKPNISTKWAYVRKPD